MVNKDSKIENVEELEIRKLEEHYEDIASRYRNIEVRTITATSKEELIDKTLKIAAQLTGVDVGVIKEQHYDEIEDCYRCKGEYYAIFKLYGYAQDVVIDLIRIKDRL